jgi:aminopeptidase N
MSRISKAFFLTAALFFNIKLMAQLMSDKTKFTHADTLRGSYGSSRNWWNVLKYDVHLKFNIADSTINGYNIIQFDVLKKGNLMQIDLQEPLVLDSIIHIHGMGYHIEKERINTINKQGNAYFFNIDSLKKNFGSTIFVYYHGKPKIAIRPPWDGGLIWKKDKNNNPFVSIACQGLGASVWYPCKDHQSDEPDSAEMHITIPDSLVCVGNGKLRGKLNNEDGTCTYDWAVTNPINNYTLIPYIGKYAHFSENYQGEKGNLTMDYWVLDYNVSKAELQFKDAPRMIKAFEYWFGPYPFYEDGYKLVESPHLGMEHQSATAYGNQYKNGYLGRDLSNTGWGLKWDYIIVHESGHEWFANNITTKDIADMWVHEGFTTYSEGLFTEYYYGKKAGEDYIIGLRDRITNNKPIIGPYNVNKEGSGDMYPKGANKIHTIRQIINNDSLFRKILRGLNKTFYHQTVTTKQIEEYISKESKINFGKVFNQYLRTIQIPMLEYQLMGNSITYRFTNCSNGFTMPVKINFNGERWIRPTQKWQSLKLNKEGENVFSVDRNFYINTIKVD